MVKEDFSILENGVKIVLSEAPSHVSYIGLLVNAGSRDEAKGNDGVMHLIEHLLFKGTNTRSYFELMDYIESVGGDMNAYTSKEETCIYITIQNQYAERAIDVLSDIFFNSKFTQSEFEKEREVVVDEINSYKDSPNELIFDEFEEEFFDKHQLASNILGNEKTLKKITLNNIVEEYNKHYISSKLIVSYVGGVNLNTIKDLFRKYFEPHQKHEISIDERMPFLGTPQFSKVKKRDTYQTHCMLGALAPSMYHDSKTTMILLNNLLGGSSFNALLNLALREERGLTYNIESNYTAYSDTGIFTVYFGTDNAKVESCKEVIYEIFNNLISSGMTQEKLEMYKNQLIGQVSLSFDNFVSLMISNAKSYMCFDKVDSYEEIIEKINKVTVQDVISLSTEVLMPDKLSILIYK